MKIGYRFTVSEYEVTPAARRWLVSHLTMGACAMRFERLVQRKLVFSPLFSALYCMVNGCISGYCIGVFPVQRCNAHRLITCRSEVQILPPQPNTDPMKLHRFLGCLLAWAGRLNHCRVYCRLKLVNLTKIPQIVLLVARGNFPSIRRSESKTFWLVGLAGG